MRARIVLVLALLSLSACGKGLDFSSLGATASGGPARGADSACARLLQYEFAEDQFLNRGLDPPPGRGLSVGPARLRALRERWEETAGAAAAKASGSLKLALTRLGAAARRVDAPLSKLNYDIARYTERGGDAPIDDDLNGALALEGDHSSELVHDHIDASCASMSGAELLGINALPLPRNDAEAADNCYTLGDAALELLSYPRVTESTPSFKVTPDARWPYPSREGWTVLQACDFSGTSAITGDVDSAVTFFSGPEWVCPTSVRWSNLEGELTRERELYNEAPVPRSLSDATWFGTPKTRGEQTAGAVRVGDVCLEVRGVPDGARMVEVARLLLPLVPVDRP